MEWCVDVSGTAASGGTRRVPWLSGAILLALLIALLVPSLAAGQAEAPVAEPPPIADAPPPPADEPAPVPADEAPPPEQAPAEEPAPAEPVPPPTSEQPAPAPAPVEPEQPAPSPVPVDEGPAPAPAPAEETPLPTTVPVLPVSPDSLKGKGEAVLGPVVVAGGGDPLKTVPTLVAAKTLGGPSAPPDPVSLTALGRPADPPSASGAAADDAGPAPPAPGRVEAALALLEPSAPITAPTRRDAAPGALSGGGDGTSAFDQLVSPLGPAPAGASSLLAVLASYVLPGGGALPTSILILFVQLAVILAAFAAPRLRPGELALALGRLGPRSGYRTVLARPG